MQHFIKRLGLRVHLLAPLYVSFLVLALILVGREGLNLQIGELRKDATEWVTHTLQVQRDGERLLKAIPNESMGLRGYLRTKNTVSLQFYMSGQAAFRYNLNQLSVRLRDNPAQVDRLEQIEHTHNDWQTRFARRAIGQDAEIASDSASADELLFESLGAQVESLLAEEQKQLNERIRRMDKLDYLTKVLGIVGALVILVGISLNIWLLRRRVELPLQKLTEAGQLWRSGDMTFRLDYCSTDELGRLAGVLNEMADRVCYRLELSEAHNRQMEDLIAALSHDLRTPLLAARAGLRSISHGAFGNVDEPVREMLEEHRRSNEGLLKLVEALLDISRYEAGRQNLILEPLNWQDIFTQAISLVCAARECPATLTYRITQPLPVAMGDGLEIRRVVQNLLDNAVQACGPDGQIKLEVTYQESDPQNAGRDAICVCVRDNGPGITPSERERLFQRFIQGRGRRGGAGLGLYLCRQIIQAHGGTIGVESQPGEGSTFWFTLLAAPQDDLSVLANYQLLLQEE